MFTSGLVFELCAADVDGDIGGVVVGEQFAGWPAKLSLSSNI